MKIAIHHKTDGFSSDWISCCENHGIDYKIVNCYSSDVISQIEGCDAVMWHLNQSNPKDLLFAKELIFSLKVAGKFVFPDFYTSWHFDDKVGQKYLLESVGAPLVPTYVFYDEKEALKWVDSETFPKVHKLRKGAGSSHVRLVNSRREAKAIVKKAFGRGFSLYNAPENLKERWRKFRNGKTGLADVGKGLIRFFYPTKFSKVAGKERGYVYFQDFISGNDSDVRVIVVDDKAFAIKRMVRKNDFRASGSGFIKYEKKNFEEETVQLSLDLAEKLNTQSLAIDFVYKDGKPLIVELSFGYVKEVYEPCEGYWDRNLNWHEGAFNPQHWMVESIKRRVQHGKSHK
jgi:glutathione synthase/RimK-type ligase-like ATP-grasp enzyme